MNMKQQQYADGSKIERKTLQCLVYGAVSLVVHVPAIAERFDEEMGNMVTRDAVLFPVKGAKPPKKAGSGAAGAMGSSRKAITPQDCQWAS